MISKMDLKTLCMNKTVDLVNALPPLLKEEVTNHTINNIRNEERKKIINGMIQSATIIIEEITDNIIECYRTGKSWVRPDHTKDIDDDLYQTYVNISYMFVNRHAQKLCYDIPQYNFSFNDDLSDSE